MEFPRHWFGGGMRVRVDGRRYDLSFSPPAKVAGEQARYTRSFEEIYGSAIAAWRTNGQWKETLAGVE